MIINQLIGERIASLRSVKNITSGDLALKAGLSVDQLDHIETGKSIPSLGVLIKISRALGLRLGTILDDADKEGPAIARAGEHRSTISFSTNENESREHLDFVSLAPNKTGRHMEPFIIEIVPNEKKSLVSSHEGEEFIYVLEGNVVIYYGNEVINLSCGDSIYIDSIVNHLVTTDTGKAKILGIVYVPV